MKTTAPFENSASATLGEPSIAKIAALLGDHARASALTALMSDRAHTATELANLANVSKQTMSAHLAKLLESNLLAVEQQGRHRYFRLANRDVAQLLESLMNLAQRAGSHTLRPGPRAPALRYARVCYDHLAGEMGVLAFDLMQQHELLQTQGQSILLSDKGLQWLNQIGLDAAALQKQKRSFCRPCLDWSERRHHLGGALGAALLQKIFENGWAQRVGSTREVRFSAVGEAALRAWIEHGQS
ncbi:MAG: winged helix-turn-helix transcriptional regulator [Burkholderiales bacterium]|nr:winged helix-turn-helix transcriptional regulator [Burkholderiales bacterium]